MELAIYFSNVTHLFDLEEAVRSLDVVALASLPRYVASVLWRDNNALEYEANLIAIERLEKIFQHDPGFSRLYFGQEFCEHLIPDTDELEKAVFFARQLDWQFTYVTGCVSNAGLKKIQSNLDLVARESDGPEVVVNDLGVLALVAREFPGVKPVLGRLLTKQLRLAPYVDTPPGVNRDGVRSAGNVIRDNQMEAATELNLSFSVYRDELRRQGIERVDLDIVPQGASLHPDSWNLEFGCYYPWTYITGTRNCLTAALTDPVRRLVPGQRPCPKLCQTLNRSPSTEIRSLTPQQRGNSVFAFNHKYATPYLEGDIPVSRVVFEPYIPI